jgi:hypothetical protein
VLDDILHRSSELEARLAPLLVGSPGSDRGHAVLGIIGVAFEHAQSLKILAAARNCTSAIGLLRLQYEAVLRGFWLHFVASDAVISKLVHGYSREEVGSNEKLTMQASMMKELEGKVPAQALTSLQDFQANHWKPLSSFIHGGIHALHRHTKGYPVDLVVNVARASNALSTMAANLVAIATNRPIPPGTFRELQTEFAACLPPIKASAI